MNLPLSTAFTVSDRFWVVVFSIEEEDIKTINIYAPNMGAPQYVRQMLTNMKAEMNSNTVIVGDFNIPTHTYG